MGAPEKTAAVQDTFHSSRLREIYERREKAGSTPVDADPALKLLGAVCLDIAPVPHLDKSGIIERAIEKLPPNQQVAARERYVEACRAVSKATFKRALRALFGKDWENKTTELRERLMAHVALGDYVEESFHGMLHRWLASLSPLEKNQFRHVVRKMGEARSRRKGNLVNPIECIILRLWVDNAMPLFMIDAPTGAVIVQRLLSEETGRCETVQVENYRKIVKRLGLPHFGKRLLRVTIRKGLPPLFKAK